MGEVYYANTIKQQLTMSQLNEGEVQQPDPRQGIRQYQNRPLCCPHVWSSQHQQGKDSEAHQLIDHFIGIMKHDPWYTFSHDSHWCPTIAVKDVISKLGTFQRLLGLQKDDLSLLDPPIPRSTMGDRYFVPTWRTEYSHRGAYLELDFKNGEWSNSDDILRVVSTFYNTERGIVKKYICASHTIVSYRCVVWELSVGVVARDPPNSEKTCSRGPS